MDNPLVLASGILGINAKLMKRVFDAGAGAVTMKSIGFSEREGHPNPTVIELEHGLINAVGLPTPGYKNMDYEWDEIKEFVKKPVIASIYGSTIDEYVKVAEFVAEKKPAIIEVNVSCPNAKKLGLSFGADKQTLEKLISRIKEVSGKVPIMPKLTPAVPDIADIALTCEQAGADAICAINTVPGMVIDIDARKPILANKFGGLSGPAIKPVAIKSVYQIYEKVSIPILGTGGISSGKDAVEMLMAGANALGVGTAVFYRGIFSFKAINNELSNWMNENGFSKIKDLVGLAHGKN